MGFINWLTYGTVTIQVYIDGAYRAYKNVAVPKKVFDEAIEKNDAEPILQILRGKIKEVTDFNYSWCFEDSALKNEWHTSLGRTKPHISIYTKGNNNE